MDNSRSGDPGVSHDSSTQLSSHDPNASPNGEIDLDRISELFEPLDTAQPKLVLLYLTIVPEGGPTEIKQTLDMNFLTVYPILELLTEAGLVEQNESHYRIQA